MLLLGKDWKAKKRKSKDRWASICLAFSLSLEKCGGWGERSAKGTRPDCQAGLACPVLRVVHCTEASHLKGSLFLHRGGNTYSGESVTVFWPIWRKVSFPNGISVTILWRMGKDVPWIKCLFPVCLKRRLWPEVWQQTSSVPLAGSPWAFLKLQANMSP